MSRPQSDLLAAAAEVAAVAAEFAEDVDSQARFPDEAFKVIRTMGLLAAAAGEEYGGGSADTATLCRVAGKMARGCGATAMVWAMHDIQLACLCRHARRAELIGSLIRQTVAENWLIASGTSEVGVGGQLRRSVAAVSPVAGGSGQLTLAKSTSVVSYGGQADALLVTARRSPESEPGDQVEVFLSASEVQLVLQGQWNTLGMRGTCSPAFALSADFDAGLVLPEPFGDVADQTMTPLSHLLWAAVWIGLATEALSRATRWSRKSPGGASGRLADAHWKLAGLKAQLAGAVAVTEPVPSGTSIPTVAQTVRLNALKLAASTVSVEIGQLALQTCGMAGYSEAGPTRSRGSCATFSPRS